MVEAQEVEGPPAPSEAGDPGLVRVQLKPQSGQDLRHPSPGLLGPGPGPAEHHEIIGEPHQHAEAPTHLRPLLVEDVEGDIGEQGGDRRALGRPRHRVGDDPVLQHPHPQPRPEQLQHVPVRHPPLNERHQDVMPDFAEAVRDVGVKHPLRAPVGLDPDGLAGHVGRSLRSEPVADRQEVGLEDGFEDDLRRRHGNAVSEARDRERPGLTRLPWFGDVHPPQRSRPVGPVSERLGELVKEGAYSGLLDGLDGHAIDAGSPSVGTHFTPRPPQDVGAADVVIEGVEPALGVLLGAAVEHTLQGSNPVHTFGAGGGPSL